MDHNSDLEEDGQSPSPRIQRECDEISNNVSLPTGGTDNDTSRVPRNSSTNNPTRNQLIQNNRTTHVSKQEIKHPQYRIRAERLVTFNDWPSQMRQKPEDLAEAGLFYLGQGDRVKCFVCDGMLHSWDPDDEPWIKHAKWFPDCQYVKMVKGDEFIRGVADGIIYTLHPVQEMADTSSSSELVLNSCYCGFSC